MREAGHKVRIVPNIKIAQGINAVRTIFPNCWFDETKCADGLNALRRYRYDVDQETGQFSRQPLHDENSHAADALRMMAVAFREEKQTKLDITPPQRPSFRGSRMGGSWMA
jgi:phage terminase large subunit